MSAAGRMLGHGGRRDARMADRFYMKIRSQKAAQWSADRPLTADLIVSGPGTAGGRLHLAGSWLSNDPDGFFNVTGTLGQKKVAVLVPEA